MDLGDMIKIFERTVGTWAILITKRKREMDQVSQYIPVKTKGTVGHEAKKWGWVDLGGLSRNQLAAQLLIPQSMVSA